VLQLTKVPVLAVPRVNGSGDLSPSLSWPGPRILAAIELGRDSQTDVNAAVTLAEWFGSSLLLLHVIPEVATPSWLRGNPNTREQILVGNARRQFDALVALARRRVHAEARVVHGRIADEIAAVAASEHIELATTTLRERRGWFGTRRGMVSYHVLSHAVSPVLAFPPEWVRRLRGATKRRILSGTRAATT
jgi:nucleotide-binding universal stress UspA family protein